MPPSTTPPENRRAPSPAGPSVYRSMDPDAEVPTVARLISHAFASPPDKSTEWLRAAGLSNLRVLSPPGGVPEACLLRIPMGQYFGRNHVPMEGVAGVAVAPEVRGRGHALRLMSELVREVAGDGVPLTALYASTQTLYRQVGYEPAGHRFTSTIPVHSIPTNLGRSKGRSTTARPLTDADAGPVQECYARFAREFNGTLVRGPYVWARVKKWRDEDYYGFGIDDERGGLAGYLYLAQTRKPTTGRHDLSVSDIAFATPDAGRGLLGFLAGFGTMADSVVIQGGPMHPIVGLLPQQTFEVSKRDYWMLRITDLGRAISMRGYPGGVRTGFTLNITDALVPSNAGLWRVTIEDQRGRAERIDRAGSPSEVVHADIRGLAAVYSGLYTARQAAIIGLVAGDEPAIAAADSAFTSGTPWMSDMF